MSEPIDYRTSRAAALTSEELLRRTTQEFIALRDSGAGMWLELHPAAAFAVVAFCQLGLRHPDASANASAPLVEQFIEYVRAKFEPHAPAIAEAIRRGNEPEHDTPRDRYLETAPITKGRDWVRERFEAAAEPPEMEQERALPPEFTTARHKCPYCGFILESPFTHIDVYICAKCGRTVETE